MDPEVDHEAAPGRTVRLTLAPEPRLLGTVRLVVATAARRAGLGDEQVEDLKVAVSEICSVAVDASGGTGEVEVDLAEEGDRFVVEIRDRAQVAEVVPAYFGSPDDRAFGLALVGSLVSGLDSFDRPGGGYVTRFWMPSRAGAGAH
jgi:anti-sigma regulatory factor (Ser/Thr protein kinase)